MNTHFGLNASGASRLFSSFNTNATSSTTSLLSDYASIKSGSYYKLLKAYYAQGETTSTSDGKKVETDDTDWKEAASDISSLKSTVGKLSSEEFTEDTRSSIEKSVSEFVKNYNAVLDSTSDINSSSLTKKAEWMKKITSNNSETLKQVGITVKSDNSLSLDKDVLSKASMNDLKSAFSGSYSYAGQINSATRLMAQVAANGGNSTTASLYTSSGTYSNLSNISLHNYLF